MGGKIGEEPDMIGVGRGQGVGGRGGSGRAIGHPVNVETARGEAIPFPPARAIRSGAVAEGDRDGVLR